MNVSSYESNFTNGYFFKIQNEKGHTEAYLLGTIHKLNAEDRSKINPKIFKALEKCKKMEGSLFVEIHTDKETLKKRVKQCFLAKNLGEKEVDEIVDYFVKNTFRNGEAVEDVLCSWALKNSLEIRGLETVESRCEAENFVREDKDDLDIKMLAISAFYIGQLAKAYDFLEEDPSRFLSVLVKTIMELDFRPGWGEFAKQRELMQSTVKKVMEQVEPLFSSWGKVGEEYAGAAHQKKPFIKTCSR